MRNPKSAFRIPQSSRRGILLLVVLSMLTLFLLIGTAFIVSANHYRQTQKTLARITETSNSTIDQDDLLGEVIGQIVRDTQNQNSSLRFHSLLRDMYGNDGILGHTNGAIWARTYPVDPAVDDNPTGGQMIDLSLNPNSVTNQFGMPYDPFSVHTAENSLPNTLKLSPMDNAYNGLVLTFLDGPARNQSVRLVGYMPTDQSTGFPAVFRVMAPRLADGSTIADPSILAESRIVINGRPFNGTGFGFNQVATAGGARGNAVVFFNDATGTRQNHPMALLPNAPALAGVMVRNEAFLTPVEVDYLTSFTPPQQAVMRPQWFLQRGQTGVGGSDESYDAVDFQNMLLALMPTNPGEAASGTDALVNVGPDGTLGTADDQQVVLPSLHRPALLNYWRQQLIAAGGTTLENDPNYLRKVLLRPNWLDHPNFTGSNPTYASLTTNQDRLTRMIYGPWDVDNDNDGVRDSVWVDFGAPVMENSDGRLVKPLAAILVVDMDGRLNVNAHGSEDIANFQSLSYNIPIADGANSDVLPHGIGYGPAEISLEPIMPLPFDVTGLTAAQIQRLRWRWYKRFFEGAEAAASFDAVDPSNDDVAAPPNTADRLRFPRRTVGKFGQRPGGRLSKPLPGIDNLTVFDLSAQLKMQGVPRWADGKILATSGTANPISGGYVTAPDFRGRYGLGLNELGQPVYESILDIGVPDAEMDTNTPYELDISLGAARGDSQTAADGPYTIAELERILRAFDSDAGALPSRLWDLAGEFKDKLPSPPAAPNTFSTTPNIERLNLWRRTATTDSYDPPVPSVVVPEWMVTSGPDAMTVGDEWGVVMQKPATGASFADLLEYRIRVAQSPVWLRSDDNVTRLLQLRRTVKKLLPQDLADGLRLDINRPLGNGRDDNNNGIVDEPGEDEGAFWASTDVQIQNAGFTGVDGRFRDDSLFLRDLIRNNNNNDDATELDTFKNSLGITGAIDTLEERIIVHNLRRQHLARDLYIIAMTLIDPLPNSNGGDRFLRARRLAQWAINVVDFRDPDNIMTAFEYDVNPFDDNGWSTDGSLLTVQDAYGPDGTFSAGGDPGGVVWGAERPELLITETLAWHDRRTENLNSETPDNDENLDNAVDDKDQGQVPYPANAASDIPDSDFDQRFIPQGAGFVELYCPWPENPAVGADTHSKDASGNDLGVNIAAVAPPNPSAPAGVTGSPVWRLMVYKGAQVDRIQGNVGGGPQKDPDSFIDQDVPRVADRSVYFAGFDPLYPSPLTHPGRNTKHVDDGVAYFNSLEALPEDAVRRNAATGINPVAPVRPGTFLVVGAGDHVTDSHYRASIGSVNGQTMQSDRGVSLIPTATGSDNSVELRDSSSLPFSSAFGPNAGLEITADANLCSVAIINRVTPNTELNPLGGDPLDLTSVRRFTFSEPAHGYPRRVKTSTMVDRGIPGGLVYEPVLDIPVDDQRISPDGAGIFVRPGGPGRNQQLFQDNEIRLFPSLVNAAVRGGQGGGLGQDISNSGRTIPGYSWVYLQRLANPLLPWNPPEGNEGHDPSTPVNPYRSIDSMGVNVTVFNGLGRDELKRRQPLDDADPIARFQNTTARESFASLQRGRMNNSHEPAFGLSELQARVQDKPDTFVLQTLNPEGGIRGKLTANLWNPEAVGNTRLGVAGLWKNTNRPTADDIGHNMPGMPDCTLGFLNQPYRDTAGEKRIPEEPYPWFTWNNRPFANASELMLVPAYRSSQLLQTFSYLSSRMEDEFKYDDDATPLATSLRLPLVVDGVFGHLMNFFRNHNLKNDGTPLNQPGLAGMHRLLDYVYVPTPYVGSETWMNPIAFSGVATNVTSVNDPRYGRQPPYNRISEYREPGRVNLNTVFSAEVWDGGVLHRELDKPDLPYDPLNADPLLNNNYLPATGHTGPLYLNPIQGSPVTQPGENGLLEARRGYPARRLVNPSTNTYEFVPALDNSMLVLDPELPTFFASPFRDSDAGSLVPLLNLARPGSECTLLRRKAFHPGLDGQWGQAGNADSTNNGIIDDLGEFDPGGTDDMEDREPLFAGASDREYNDTDRSAFFSYQPMTRLSSMTTNRSNVYAVWITIGFFEVQEAPDWASDEPYPDGTPVQTRFNGDKDMYDQVYPEGYQFGQEAGIETGNIVRVREFAMVDRTVPVAFEPGQQHNVDKAIRLRRRIE